MSAPASSSSTAAAFKAEGHSCFVIGWTGEVGKELVKSLAAQDAFKKVVLVGRRESELPKGPGYDKMEQRVVDFDKLLEAEGKAAFKGCDVGFCALGTTRGKSGVAGFIKVDHDYVLNAAKAAKEAGGLKQFHVVTSTGSNAKSPMLYPKTKGRTEEDLKALGLERLAIYRPGMLMCDRVDSRPLERLGRFVLAPVAAVLPTLITCPTSVLGKALAANAVDAKKPAGTVEVLENKEIHAMAKAFSPASTA